MHPLLLAAMPFGETLGLGAIAGFTIFLGLPLGRVRALQGRPRVVLAMLAVGILLYIFLDVGSHGVEILEGELEAFKHHKEAFGTFVAYYLLLVGGFFVGSVGITTVEQRLKARSQPAVAGGAVPAAQAATAEIDHHDNPTTTRLRLAMTVAAAIGLHNFAEGLAIGVSAATGAVALATVLVIGFALHNSTEGFAIVGPLGEVRPSRRWLALAGLIGGGPTFLGTLVGYEVSSRPLELLFYALAAGALAYVIGEIWGGMRRFGYRQAALIALSVGFLIGVLTDLVVTYGGA
jgi:ZIP family zinc transporter